MYKCVLPTVKHGGGSVMVSACMSAAGTEELQLIEGTMNDMYCDILKHDPLPSGIGSQGSILTQRPKTHLQDNHCLAKEAEGKGNIWGIPKRKVEERKVSLKILILHRINKKRIF